MQIAREVVSFPSKTSASRFTLSTTIKGSVFTEITKVVRGSKIWWRGRSYAASVPSDIPKAQKGRKRVSKDERQALVVSFVKKYRAMNAGKFPTASDTRKEVGGSYYVIRKIIQELEYNLKMSPVNKSNENFLAKELTKEDKPFTEVVEVSSSQMTVDAEIQNGSQKVAVNGGGIGDTSDSHLKAQGRSQTSTSVMTILFKDVGKSQTVGDRFDFVATQSHLQEKETKDASHTSFEKPEDGEKKEAAAEDLQDFDGPKHKTEQDQGSFKLDNFARNISGKQTKDKEPHKNSTMWGNLKSLADGIINIWRKL